MKTTGYRLGVTVLLGMWMVVIFLFSAQPAVDSDKVSKTVAYRVVEKTADILHLDLTENQLLLKAEAIDLPIRKAAHMTEYAIMGLLSFAFYHVWGMKGKGRYLAALLTSIIYAATDEFHQLFVPGRSGQLKDVCIDTAGAVIGLIILYFILKLIRRHCEMRKYPLQ